MLRRLIGNCSGAAAAETVLVAPLLIILMFGSMELGYYFYSEHVVVAAVRDGARFASRAAFEKFTCPSTIDSTVADDTKRVTRTNQVEAGGTARLPNWTDDSSVTVTLSCVDNSTATYGSIYDGLTSVPVVSVTATVSYASLFSSIGFNATSLELTATANSAVMGG